MKRNPVGVGPIGWVNDDLRDWGADRDGDDVLREISEIGFDGTEMSYRFPAEPGALKEKLASHGLVLAAAYRWTNLSVPEFHEEELRLAREHVDFCRAAGARFVTVAEGGGSLHWDRRGPADKVTPVDGEAFHLLLDGLHETGRYAREQGLTLSIHPHGGTAFEAEDDIARLFGALDPELVGYCYDSGHVLYGGGDPGRVAERWADRITYVHLKDVRLPVLESVRREGLDFAAAVRRNVFCTPGSGGIDFDRPLAALKEAGYRGWYVIEAEQDPAQYDAATVSREALTFLRERYGIGNA